MQSFKLKSMAFMLLAFSANVHSMNGLFGQEFGDIFENIKIPEVGISSNPPSPRVSSPPSFSPRSTSPISDSDISTEVESENNTIMGYATPERTLSPPPPLLTSSPKSASSGNEASAYVKTMTDDETLVDIEEEIVFDNCFLEILKDDVLEKALLEMLNNDTSSEIETVESLLSEETNTELNDSQQKTFSAHVEEKAIAAVVSTECIANSYLRPCDNMPLWECVSTGYHPSFGKVGLWFEKSDSIKVFEFNKEEVPFTFNFPDQFHALLAPKNMLYQQEDFVPCNAFSYQPVMMRSEKQFAEHQNSRTLGSTDQRDAERFSAQIDTMIKERIDLIDRTETFLQSSFQELEKRLHDYSQETEKRSFSQITLGMYHLEEKANLMQPQLEKVNQKLNAIPGGAEVAIKGSDFCVARNVYQETKTALECAELFLKKTHIVHDMQFAQNAILLNKEKIIGLVTTQALKAKEKLKKLSLQDLHETLSHLNEQKSVLATKAIDLETDFQNILNEKAKNVGKLNSEVRGVLRNLMNRSIESRVAKVKVLDERAREAYILWQDAQAKYRIVEQTNKYITEIIGKRNEILIRDEIAIFHKLSQELYDNPGLAIPLAAREAGLIKAIQQTRIENGAESTKKHSLGHVLFGYLKIKKTLEELVPENKHMPYIEFTGNAAQQYVCTQFVKSLNRLSDISQGNSQVQPLLKQAAHFILFGQTLNKEHKISNALSANLACNAILDFAEAIAEGTVAGVVENVSSLVSFGKNAADFVSFPEKSGPLIQAKFDKAVLATCTFLNAARKDFDLAHKGDEASLKELEERH